jgi:peptide chain release factor 2
VWNNHKEMQKINQEKVMLAKSVEDFQGLSSRSQDAKAMLELVVESEDESLFQELKSEAKIMNLTIRDLEIKSLLSQPLDMNNAFLSVNSGAGGTEACDWAEMLMRMYVRYAERQGYKVDILSINQGEEAGIKSATLNIQGPFAYGYLKAESGVHRLVRISPFDSNARRHTSFASVSVWAEVDDTIEIEIKESDLKIDTYRASGSGGQHVNRTDSAVRITHMPTNTIIACQSQRSQHANRDYAMKMLKAALYELERQKLEKERDALEAQKKANEWGSQIRSYVLHPYKLVKDHRMEWESGQPDKFLDGDLTDVIEAFLKSQTLGSLKQ